MWLWRLRFRLWNLLVAVALMAVVVSWLRPANWPKPRLLSGAYGFQHALALSPDERWIVCGGLRTVSSHQSAGVVTFREVVTGRTLWTYEADRAQRFEAFRFLAGGKILAGLNSWSLLFWDVSTGRLVRTMRGPWDRTLSQAMSADGALVAWACETGIRLQDETTEAESAPLVGPPSSCLTFSLDGKFLAAARGWVETSSPDDVTLWDVTARKPKAVLKGHTRGIGCLVFAADGRTLASSGIDDGSIKLWDVATGGLLLNLHGRVGIIRGVVFTPDGTTLATVIARPGQRCDEITFWDVSRANERSLISTGKEYVNSLAFTRDGRTLVAGCEDGTVLFLSADR